MKGKKAVGIIGVVVVFLCIFILFIFWLAPVLNLASDIEVNQNHGTGISGFLFANINFIIAMLLIVSFIAVMGYFK